MAISSVPIIRAAYKTRREMEKHPKSIPSICFRGFGFWAQGFRQPVGFHGVGLRTFGKDNLGGGGPYQLELCFGGIYVLVQVYRHSRGCINEE